MTKIYLSLALLCCFLWPNLGHAQDLRIRKGVIVDALKMQDSIADTYALYLPKQFELKGSWPLLAVFDMEGNTVETLSKFVRIADSLGFVVAAPHAVNDSLSLSENMVRTKRMLDHLVNLLPLGRNRVYTAGFSSGGRFANLVPIFIKDVSGTLAINASLVNLELLSLKNPFQFIGVIDKTNYNYPAILGDEKVLNGFKFPNHLLVGLDEGAAMAEGIAQALSYFQLHAMAKGERSKDTALVAQWYQRDMANINKLLAKEEWLLADRAVEETLTAFKGLRNTEQLQAQRKELKKNKAYRALKRQEENTRFTESLLTEDFAFYLEEDVVTYNFNNLGWWRYQMARIYKYVNSQVVAEQQMGKRLGGYVSALVEDYVDVVKNQEVVDEEALVFLYMLKTIIAPKTFDHYFAVVALAAKNEDFGTALFYMEEALKNGYASKEGLYAIPNTALLRITPEFNALVKKYFDDTLYQITED